MSHVLARQAASAAHSPARHAPVWRPALATLPTLFALLLAAPAQAEERTSDGARSHASGPELSLRYGQENGNDYRQIGLAARFAPVWQKDMKTWQASLSPEVEYNHFRYRGDAGGRSHNNELGAALSLRAEKVMVGVHPYAEIGIGGAWFTHDNLGPKDLGSHFQFSEHVGVGARFAERWSASYRFTHYSNAGIESPDNGLNLHQLMVGVAF